jgi:membrane dipeptidase
MLGNSLGVLRCFAELGVRYLTLTHTNHNGEHTMSIRPITFVGTNISGFASSAGSGAPIEACHEGNGLSELGKELIYELNRLGSKFSLVVIDWGSAEQQ